MNEKFIQSIFFKDMVKHQVMNKLNVLLMFVLIFCETRSKRSVEVYKGKK
jgi:hypothetical protein